MTEDQMDWDADAMNLWSELDNLSQAPDYVEPPSPILRPTTNGLLSIDESSFSNNGPPPEDPTEEQMKCAPFKRELASLTSAPEPRSRTQSQQRLIKAWENDLSHELIEKARTSGLKYGLARPVVSIDWKWFSSPAVEFLYTLCAPPQIRDIENSTRLKKEVQAILNSRGLAVFEVHVCQDCRWTSKLRCVNAG
jgi:hypothetical protein